MVYYKMGGGMAFFLVVLWSSWKLSLSLSLSLSLPPLLRTTVVPSHGQQPLQPPDWSKASLPASLLQLASPDPQRSLSLSPKFQFSNNCRPPTSFKPHNQKPGGSPLHPLPYPFPPLLSFRVHTHRSFMLSPNVLSHSCCVLSILHVFTEYLFIYLICVCVYIYIYIIIYLFINPSPPQFLNENRN
jgi:hypothetical protein